MPSCISQDHVSITETDKQEFGERENRSSGLESKSGKIVLCSGLLWRATSKLSHLNCIYFRLHCKLKATLNTDLLGEFQGTLRHFRLSKLILQLLWLIFRS